MSRSGYSDDLSQWSLIRYRGQVASAMRGKRGQRLFADLIKSLDAMPDRRLIKSDFQCSEGVCALGAVGLMRGIDVAALDPDNIEGAAATFDIAEQLAREVVFENDEGVWDETPEVRWQRMRRWAEGHLIASGEQP